jgi:dolichol kinase
MIRRKIWLFRFMFRSLDRPEDRPYTLLWNSTQNSATITIQLLMTLYFESTWDKPLLALVPVIVVGLGDGAAEPIGVKFGKHKYTTRAFCSNKKYTRSYEGSAAVFFFGCVAVAVAINNFDSGWQIMTAFLTIPISVTITEAWAPRKFSFLWFACVLVWEGGGRREEGGRGRREEGTVGYCNGNMDLVYAI